MFWKVQAMMGVPIWVSFFWRRATAAGAWASTLSGFLAWFFTSKINFIGWDFNARFAKNLPDFMLYDGQLSLPWQMIMYLTISLVTMIVVSFITRKTSIVFMNAYVLLYYRVNQRLNPLHFQKVLNQPTVQCLLITLISKSLNHHEIVYWAL